MTVLVDDTVERYTVSGVGPYEFSSRIFAETDLAVTACSNSVPPVATRLNFPGDYTVAGANDQDGGEVTLIAGVASTYAGYTLDIRTNTPTEQPTSIRNQGRFLPEIHEDAFDRLSRQSQDIKRLVNQSVRGPDYEPALDMTLPVVATRAGRFAGFDSLGQPVALSGTGNDTAFRTDLAATVIGADGTRLAGFRRSELGSVARTLHAVLSERQMFASDFGYSVAASAATNAAAITAAIAALGVIGGRVFLPIGWVNCNPFTIPAYVTVYGMGPVATRLLMQTTGYNITLGGDTNTLSSGCGLKHLSVVMDNNKAAHGVYLLCTRGAVLENLYIEGTLVEGGAPVVGRSNEGVTIAAGAQSSFYNHILDVDCNHVQFAFTIKSIGGGSRATNQRFTNCTGLGDVLTVGGNSRGLRVIGTNGDGTIFDGGNLEHYAIAIDADANALGAKVTGTRFEANVTDIRLLAGCQPWTFDGIETETDHNVSDSNNVGIFVSCRTTSNGPWKSRMPGGLQFGNTGDNLQKYIRLGTTTFVASTSAVVTFATAEPDANYRVIPVETSGAGGIASYRITSRGTGGFTIVASASNSNTVDWMLVR